MATFRPRGPSRRDRRPSSSGTNAPPTAIAVESSDGHVRVFLPPLEHAEDVVELLAVIEAVADELECPVVVEGYPLPRDPR